MTDHNHPLGQLIKPPGQCPACDRQAGAAFPYDRGGIWITPDPKWDARGLGLAREVSTWSSCTRDKVGAVVMSPEHDVVATGFNDTPSGRANCGDGGCPRAQRCNPSGSPQLDDEVCLHAEGNALQRAGLNARGATLYVTRQPCPVCTRIADTAKIARIVVS